jgi:hypothetical protein
VWVRAISLSDRLGEKTWKLLVVLQCVIFILSAGGFREARLSGPAVRDVSVMTQPPGVESVSIRPPDLRRPAGAPRQRPRGLARTAKRRSRQKSEPGSTTLVAAQRLDILRREYVMRAGQPLTVTSLRRTQPQTDFAFSRIEGRGVFDFAGAGSALSASAVGSKFLIGDVLWAGPSPEFSSTECCHAAFSGFDAFPGLGKFVEPSRSISVQLSQPEGGNYRRALLFWVSLFGLIVSPVSAASTAVVAWVSVHRGRADALLKELQIEKMRLEMEKLRVELEQARREAERHGSPIIISAG